MKKLIVIAFGSLLAAAPALADDWDFVLTNATGKMVTKLEVAPTGTATWAENRVDSELHQNSNVKPGGKTTVHFDKGSSCKYDVRATFDDASTAIWPGFNICDYSYITVTFTAGSPTFKAN